MLVAAAYVLTGLVWTGRSMLEVLAHPDYWDPVTALDWLAIWSYSLAFALLALTIPLLARDSRAGRLVDVTAVAVTIAAALASVANLVEDWLGVAGASAFYVIGVMGALVGLIALAAGLFLRHRRSSALVALLLAAGVGGMILGMGWLVLAAGVLAARNHLAAHQQTRNAHA